VYDASIAARAGPDDAGALGRSEGGCRAKSGGESAGVASRACGVSEGASWPGDDSRSEGRAVAANGAPGSRGGTLVPFDRETLRLPGRPLLAPTRSRPPPHRIGGRRSLVEWDEESGRAPRSGREWGLRSVRGGSRRPLSPPRARHTPGGARGACVRSPQRAKAFGPTRLGGPELRFLGRPRVLGSMVRRVGRASDSSRRSPRGRPRRDLAVAGGLAAARAHPLRRSSGWREVPESQPELTGPRWGRPRARTGPEDASPLKTIFDGAGTPRHTVLRHPARAKRAAPRSRSCRAGSGAAIRGRRSAPGSCRAEA